MFLDPPTKRWIFSHSGTRSQSGKFVYLTEAAFNDLLQTDEGSDFLRTMILDEYDHAVAKLEGRWTFDYHRREDSPLRGFAQRYLQNIVFQSTRFTKQPDVILSTEANRGIRNHISKLLKAKPVEIITDRFPDREIRMVVKKPKQIKGKNCLIVHDVNNDEDFVELLVSISGLRDAGAKNIACVLPARILENNELLSVISSFVDVYTAVFYRYPTSFKPYEPEEYFFASERIMLEKHLAILLENNQVELHEGKYKTL